MAKDDDRQKRFLADMDKRLSQAYRLAVQAERLKKLGTDEQRARMTQIENFKRQARARIDDKFEQNKRAYWYNEILYLQRQRGAHKLNHKAPYAGMVDAMDGPGIEREAWMNVLRRQRNRRLRVETRGLDLTQGLMLEAERQRTARRQFNGVARGRPERDPPAPERVTPAFMRARKR